MNLLDREFLGDFFKTFGFLVLFLCIVFLVKVYLDFYEDISTADSGVYWAFVYYLCRLPEFFVQTGVVSVAASILWIVTRKARNNEILAWMAGGISPKRMALPFMAAAVVITCANLALSEFVLAEAEQKAYYVEKRYLIGKSEEEIIQSENIYQRGAEGRLYLIERYDPVTNRMERPTIIQVHDKTQRPAWILHAAEAVPAGDEGSAWQFVEASVKRISPTGRVEEFKTYDRVTDQELGMPMEPKLRKFLDNLDDPDQMNLVQLWEYIKLLDAQGKPISEYLLILHTKLALPIAVLVIALLMCGHVLRPKSQGMIFGLGGGLVWIVLYYGAFITCQRLGEATSVLPPYLLIWLPNAIFGLLGLALITRLSIRGFALGKG